MYIGYKVTYTRVSGGGPKDIIVNGITSTNITLTKLSKWTNYSITVLVYNDKGDGPSSAAVAMRTKEDSKCTLIHTIMFH